MKRLYHIFKNKVKRYISKKEFINEVKIKSDEWFFVFPYGIGDFYIFLSLLNAFKREHKAYNISIGLVKPVQSQLIDLFSVEVNRIIVIKEVWLPFCSRDSLVKGVPIVLHPVHFLNNSLHSIIGYKGLTLNDIYKIMMNLSIHTTNETPFINPSRKILITEKFKDYNFNESKTVLLSPHANSFDENLVPFSFWERLIKTLNCNGYQIFINSKREPYVNLKTVTPVDFSLKDAIPFVDLCKNFIGIRSGFCDLISSSKSKKIIIYPDLKWYSGNLLTGASLQKMQIAAEPIIELELNNNFLEENISLIIKTLEE